MIEHASSRCSKQLVCWTNWSVTCIVSRCHPHHSVDVFLDVLNESFDDVHLLRTVLNELLNGMINLLFILAIAAQLEKFLLLSPLWSLMRHLIRCFVILCSWHLIRQSGSLIHIGVACRFVIYLVFVKSHSIISPVIFVRGNLHLVVCGVWSIEQLVLILIILCWLLLCRLLLQKLVLLLFNELLNKVLFIDLVIHNL